MNSNKKQKSHKIKKQIGARLLNHAEIAPAIGSVLWIGKVPLSKRMQEKNIKNGDVN